MTTATTKMRRAAHGLDDAPNWRTHAPCRHNPDQWDADGLGPAARARRNLAAHICWHHCPVYHDCHTEATEHPHRYPGMVIAGIRHLTVIGKAKTGDPVSAHQPAPIACGPHCRRYTDG